MVNSTAMTLKDIGISDVLLSLSHVAEPFEGGGKDL